MKVKVKVRHIVLSLLAVSVIAPIFLYTDTVGAFFDPYSSRLDSLDDVAAITLSGDTRHLHVVPLETSTALKEPFGILDSDHSINSFPNETAEHKFTRVLSAAIEEHQPRFSNPITQANESQLLAISLEEPHTQTSSKMNQEEHLASESDIMTEAADAQVRHLKDLLIRAKVYISLPAIKSNPRATRELRGRIKEVSRALGDAAKDSDLPRNAFDKLKAMEQSLEKCKHIQDKCDALVKRLRAMLHSTEELLRVHRKKTTFLAQLTAKTLTKGLHCLPLRLTTEYYTLNSSQQNFLDEEKLEDPRLYHYALFSDNILAAAVVVNSTLSHAKHPSKHVFHIVTDRLNYAAMRMWFLRNLPGKAAIQVQNIEEFSWLNSSYSPVLKQLGSASVSDYYFRAHRVNSDSNLKFRNPKYLSILNHLRFYLPEIFPKLNKVLFLDDDVVVQKDLSDLWSLNLKGNVNGAVDTCGESFHRFDRYLNFSNPLISKNFDRHACGWAYGMNIFDLAEWRRQNITDLYHRWQKLNRDRQLWKLGTLPPGLVTFWKRTYTLDRSWHVLGLGYNPNVNQREIEQAAVIHYNGNLKPWLDIGMPKYKNYWAKYVDYDHIYLRDCNINP
ncbi:putative galacturonosyltransferase 4 [Hibiscus syriacus]|uniref:Hexosyltransferase n=1 Tax=Hibiscus syriacus TaxID=106335 RepID=A0A6A2WLD8_HIBSY|nr:probable galacturonosyltransferase 4 [Hibiscus syriacus]KAE8659801.1 putative galacturonosyltransferase 4 [Hibiscus syriacus]